MRHWNRARILSVNALICLAATTSHAEVAVNMEATGAVKLFQLRTTDGASQLSRRVVTQFLGMSVHSQHDGPHLEARLRLRLDSDLGMAPVVAARLDHPDAQFIAADVQLAAVRVRHLLNGHLDLTLGRDVLIDPVGAQTIDGAQLHLRTHDGLFVNLYTGLGVIPQQRLSFDTTFGHPWAHPRDPLFNDTPLTFGAGAGFQSPRLRAQVALRRTASSSTAEALQPPDELTPMTAGRRALIDDRLGASIYANPIDALSLTSQLTWTPATRQLERLLAEVLLQLPLYGDPYVGLQSELFAPSFPMGTVWSAFGTSAMTSAGALAGARLPAGAGQLQLDAQSHVRFYAAADGADAPLPGADAHDTQTLEGRLYAAWTLSRPDRLWTSELSVYTATRAETGYDGRLILGEVGARVELYRDTWWARLRALGIRHQRDLQPLRSGDSAGALLETSFLTTYGGVISMTTEYTSTPDFLHALRVTLQYGLDLEIYR